MGKNRLIACAHLRVRTSGDGQSHETRQILPTVSERSGKQIIRRGRILLLTVLVLSIALYAAYVVWAVRVQEGALRWFLVLLPLVVGGLGGYKWYRDYNRWMKE
jgi:cell division septal protein FtsQ